MAADRQWTLAQALRSYASLQEALPNLSEEDVLAALDLEAASRRRRSIMDRLIARAVRLRELKYVTQLKERYS